MGYFVTITEADFQIPEREDVLQVLKDLNHDPSVIKRGSGWQNGQKIGSWFSWMPENYDEHVTSVKEVFELLGFDTREHEDTGGNRLVELVGYDSKIGQEDLFLMAVAPFVSEGNYINWRGEDGALYRHEVRDGALLTLEPVLNWK